MKKKLIYALSLVLVLSIGFSVGAIASNGKKTASLYYRDIKITLDGKELVPKDADGNYVEPFIIDGTTYLPVRGISNVLGLDVDWDGASGTVILKSPQDKQSVYITRTGSKYHYDAHCNGGTYWAVPFSTATGMNLKPCDKCVH